VAALVFGLALAAVSAAAGQPQRSAAQAQWILFSALPNGTGSEEIFRISPSGTGLKQLTTAKAPSQDPAFSPDGKRIAFARLGAGIFSMSPDGTGLRRLTTNARDTFPAWSPDGKQIAFLRPGTSGWRIYVMSASGAAEHWLRSAPPAGRPSWTAQGLVIPTNGDLARIDPQTGHVKKLFGAFIDASVGVDTTSVSADLSTATFVGPRPPDPGDKDCGDGIPCAHFGLFTENLRTTKTPKLLVKDAGPAAFSRDGKSLAFVAKNRIVVWLLKSGTSRSIATGTSQPTTSAPPSW
jgi:dipeptidyl aminopeptidase/acylaminoacyl peptidase